jgi:hypothetical protein
MADSAAAITITITITMTINMRRKKSSSKITSMTATETVSITATTTIAVEQNRIYRALPVVRITSPLNLLIDNNEEEEGVASIAAVTVRRTIIKTVVS